MKIRNILSTIILVLVLTLTVGFSAFVSEMSISNIVSVVRVEKDVRITGFSVTSGSMSGGLGELNWGADSIMLGDSINGKGDNISLEVTITNIGSAEVGIYDIVVPEGIDFEITNYNMKSKLCDSSGKCNLGSSKTIRLNVSNSSYSDVENGVKIDFDFREFHSVTYDGITNNGYTTEVIDGDSLSVTFSEDIPKNIEVYSDGVLLGSDKYSYTNNTLNIYSVTGNIVIKKGVPVAKLVSGSLDTVGSEVCIGSECFYIISNDGTTVSMLSKYNLHVGNVYDDVNGKVPLENPTGIQSANARGFFRDDSYEEVFPFVGTVAFSYENSTSYSETNIKMYVDDYENYLENLGVTISNSRLMNVNEVKELCPGYSCSDTKYEWLLFTTFWLDYINEYNVYESWYFTNLGAYMGELYFEDCYYGVRPVIEILEEDIVNPFEVKVVSGNVNTAGSEVCLGTECFYVLSSTNDSVTMLSKYNLYVGNSIDEEWNITPLSNPTGIQDKRALGWYEEDDGPIFPVIGTVSFGEDGSTYDTSTIKGYVDVYGDYLRSLGFDITSSRLLSFDEIMKFPHQTIVETDITEYLFRDSNSWIFSTSYWLGTVEDDMVYRMDSFGNLYIEVPTYEEELGVRPVITISKEYF